MSSTILIIDDLYENLEFFEGLFTKYLPEMRVIKCPSGTEALALAESVLPDLVVVDAKMPEMDGFEVCKRLKAMPATARTPILMISGYMVESKDRIHGLQSGADGYLCKPFEAPELIAQARSLLRMKSYGDQLLEHQHALEEKLASRTTHLQESQDRLQYRLSFEELIARLSTHFVSLTHDRVDEGIRFALGEIGSFCNADRCYLFELSPANSTMSNTHEWCTAGVAPAISYLQNIPIDRFPWLIAKLSGGESINLPRIEQLPPEAMAEREEFTRENIRSIALVPILTAGTLLGFLGLDAVDRNQTWSGDALRLLKIGGEIVGNALLHRDAEARQQRIITGLRGVLAAANKLILCPDLDSVYRTAVEFARQGIGVERCGIFMDEGTYIAGTYGTDMKGETTDETSLKSYRDPDWTQRHQKLLRDRGLWFKLERELTDWDGSKPVTIGSGWVVVTLILGKTGEPIGVMSNDTAISGRPADADQQDILAVYCALLGKVIELKKAEIDQRRLARAIDQSVEAIVITDTHGQIQYVNPGFERITGYTREEVVGKTPRLLKSGNYNESFYANLWNTLLEGRSWKARMINRRKDGSHYEVDETISPIRDAAGKLVNFVSVSHDITREAQLEEEIRQSQKMEGIGRLAGGIAHDFNNLLTAILGYSRIVQERLAADHPCAADVEEIIRAAERAARLTSQLLAFGRKQTMRVHPVEMNAIILNMENLLRRSLGEDVLLDLNLSPDAGHFMGDKGYLEQVVMNLAVNARDAMNAGGHLKIRTRTEQLDAEFCNHRVGILPGPHVMLSVLDSGVGIPDEISHKIFDPFFTTKGESRGTGLGLSTVYGIVRQLNGYIEFESRVGAGTEFRIYFPSCPPAVPEKPRPQARVLPKGTETILVVEDEDTVRHLTSRILQGLGYTVLQARSGAMALDIAALHPETIHLVLTDVVMPEMSGPTLVEKLSETRSDFRALYISGFTPENAGRSGGLKPGSPLIQKPYTREELARRVRQALNEKPTDTPNKDPKP